MDRMVWNLIFILFVQFLRFVFVAAQHKLKYRVNTGQIKCYLLQCNKLERVF
jgi:hypothetical protein